MTLKRAIKRDRKNQGCILYSGICNQCNKWFYCDAVGFLYGQKNCSIKCMGKIIGKNHPHWTGGTIVNGYKIVRWKGKRIPEHRKIMEKFIKRELKPFENIHHKNGIRTDNKIENLELWTVRQPFGQRVSDLIKFVGDNYKNEIIEYLHITPLGA